MDTSGPDGSAQRPAEVVAWIGSLCEQGVRASGVDGAGVSVIALSGGPQPVMSTDERSAVIEDLQFTLGEGPCFDATSHRSPVLISDLTRHEEGVASRWPAFLNEAVAAGVRAVFAFPLGMGATTVGTLDLYRSTPGPLSEQQLNASLVTADSIGVALLTKDPVATLEQSSRLRMTVHQAAGMVMVQTGGTIGDALLLLRASAYGEGRSINDIAADVLAGRRRYDEEQS